VSTKSDRNQRQVIGLFGVGLDNKDEHTRITRSEHFVLLGGSAETHEQMQDTAIRFSEALRDQGKTLQETSVEEVIDLLYEAVEKRSP